MISPPNLVPRLPPVGYFNAHVGNQIRFAAPWGDDAFDGYDWRTPKKTILGAWDSLPNGATGGGTINFANGTHIGGEVPGQGLWIAGERTNITIFDPHTVRDIVVTGTDHVVASTRTWTFANGTFTNADVNKYIKVAGATNPGNNGQFQIASVTNGTTIVTTGGTQVDETFSGSVTLELGAPFAHVLYPGWRYATKPVSFIGHGSGPLLGEFSDVQAQMLRGNPGDLTRPGVDYDVGIWITASSFSLHFENIFLYDFSIGKRMAVNDNPANDPRAPINRGSQETVAGVVFKNVTTQNDGVFSGTTDIGQGPSNDYGYFLFCTETDCCANSYPQIAPIDDDRRAGWLIKPETGNGTSRFEATNLRGSHGGITYYSGGETWGIFVRGFEVESDFVDPLPTLVKLVGLDGNGFGYLSDIRADDGTPFDNPVIDNSGGLNLDTQLILANTGFSNKVLGPVHIVGSANADGNRAVTNWPATQKQSGFFAGRYFGDLDNVRRAGPVITSSYYNLYPQHSGDQGLVGPILNTPDNTHTSNRVWTSQGAVGAGTIDDLITDNWGGTTAIKISTNDSSTAFQKLFDNTVNTLTGDRYVFGCWVRLPSGAGGPVLAMTINSGTVTEEDHTNTLTNPPIGGDGWQFMYGWAKVASTSGGSPQAALNVSVNANPGFPTIIDRNPVILKVPASVSDNDFFTLLQNLSNFTQTPPGAASTQPGQLLIAQGGLGVGNVTQPGLTLNTLVDNLVEISDQNGAPLGYAVLKKELPPGAPTIYWDGQNIDGASNSTIVDGLRVSRIINATGTDNVVASTHTWTFANGGFTAADVGRYLLISGASNSTNNDKFKITSVTNPTTVVTNGTQADETFTGGSFRANVGIAWKNVAGSPPSNTDIIPDPDDIFGPHSPFFHKIAARNQIKNQSSLENHDSARIMTPVFTAIPQPYSMIVVFRVNNTVAPGFEHGLVAPGPSGFPLVGFTATTFHITLNAGNSVDTGLIPSANRFHVLAVNFNGASSSAQLDSTPTGTINLGTNSLTQLALFEDTSIGADYFYGDIVAFMVYADGTPLADILAFLNRKYGVFPQ